ncbi:hypothetical protein VTN77DRAFT_7835 [Rasamsonia byssochlamydoides]|uniref:uncharacterized protein n=1 Tax=Rasamsonia byssochlamydoides TaxID=89139 RepID=UPI003743A07B
MASSSQRLADPAQIGFAKASSYDKYRPAYTDEEADQLLTALQLTGRQGAKVLDLAAGMGKFTEVLAARPEGFETLAVEPHDDMRAELEKKALRGVQVRKGWASSIPLESKSVDAVVVAQAFHWFANHDALKEIHRILKPRGRLGLIWHIEDYNAPASAQPTTKWESQLKDIVFDFEDNHPRFRHDVWRAVFDEEDQRLFSKPLTESLLLTVFLPKTTLWDRFCTLSQFALLQGIELQNVKDRFDAALQGEDVEVNEAGEVALHGKTYLAWTEAQ